MVAAMVGCVLTAEADVSYKIANANIGASKILDGNTSVYQDLDQFDVKFNNSSYNNILAGGIMISQPKGSNDKLPNNYVSVCTDFLGSLYLGSTYQYDNQAVPITSKTTGIDPGWNDSVEAGQLASELFNTYGDVGLGGIGTGGSKSVNAAFTVEDMAALQLAVWMVLYDTSGSGTTTKVNYTSGEFQVTSAVGNDSDAILLAKTWVGAVVKIADKGPGYTKLDSLLVPDPKLGVQGNPDKQVPQELLYSSVPEPATILGGLLLLLPLGASTIRKLRKSQVK